MKSTNKIIVISIIILAIGLALFFTLRSSSSESNSSVSQSSSNNTNNNEQRNTVDNPGKGEESTDSSASIWIEIPKEIGDTSSPLPTTLP